ncbi:MAG: SpoIIE family protein phosphatase [Actinomycetota bacterium]
MPPPPQETPVDAPSAPVDQPADKRLAAQYAVIEALAEATTLEEAAPRVLGAICDCLDWELASLWVIDERADVLRCRYTWHSEGAPTTEMERATAGMTLAKGQGLPGRVWETGQPLWVSDITADPSFPRARLARKEGLHAGFGSLLEGKQVVGVIETFSPHVLAPDEKMAEALQAFGRQLGQLIERTRAEESLRRSEARKGAMIQSALDCVIGMDHEGRIIEFNPAAEATFGHRSEEVLGERLGDVLIPLPYRELHYRGLARYLATGEHEVLNRRIQISGLRADGSEFPVELAITPVTIPGEPPVFTAFLRDITDRVAAEEEHARLLISEQAARAQAEIAQRRMAFLADVNTRLSTELDFQAALGTLAEMAVPRMADWCLVDVASEDGRVLRVAIAHADPTKAALADELRTRLPHADFKAIQTALNTGESIMTADISQSLADLADEPEHARLLREIGATSSLVVPLVARGKTLGTLTFLLAESGRRYSSDDLSLAEELARRAAVSIDNARLFQERSHVARVLQRSLLPPRPPSIPGIDVAARYEAAGEGNQVGGDFYDVFRCGRHRWAIVMGDVCGKGPDAAAVTGLARYTLRAAQFEKNAPSQVLPALNRAILEQAGGERFATVVLALLETGRRGPRLTVCSAGHPLPLLRRRDGTVEELGTPGTVLGLFDEVELTDATMQLLPGEAVLFYTDGVTDIGMAESDPAVVDLESLLGSFTGDEAALLADRVRDGALSAQGGTARDDIAVLVVRVPDTAEPGQPSPGVRLDAPITGGFKAPSEARRLLDALARELEPELLEDLRFLVNELVTNSVRHAPVGAAGKLRVRVLTSAEVVRVEVSDAGEGFVPEPTPPRADQDSGWGMYLLDQLSDRWGTDRAGDRFTMWFELDRAPSARPAAAGR